MCGLAGIVNVPNARHTVEAMVRSIAHRGPDASGVFVHERENVTIGLGHARLSILDLTEAGNQPFRKDGLTIVFNGEIYNFRDLARELAQRGVVFRSGSDTEVLLEAWRAWGPSCLVRLRGMFAFALLDENTGKLFIARDHFGIKPLFFCQRGEQIAFASEIKALLQSGVVAPEIDYGGVVASLLYVWVPDARSVFKGVSRLPPGSWAEVSPNGVRIQTYFDAARDLPHETDEAMSPAALAEVIEKSVRAHMIADVPVGTFLSGGLDSSLITAMARREAASLRSFTIGFREQDKKHEAVVDDLHYARIVAKNLGVDLQVIEINPDVHQLLPKMVAAMDEPIGDAAAINTYLICQTAREQGMKVLLSGMGADELFAGYRRHYAWQLGRHYRTIPRWMRANVIEAPLGRMPVASNSRGFKGFRWAKRFVDLASLPPGPSYQRSYSYFSGPSLKQLLQPELHEHVDRLLAEHADIFARSEGRDPINRLCMTDVYMFLVGLNLTYTDRASMAASTEVRVPFVDIEVAKAAFAIRGAAKLKGRESKSILKEAANGWIPKDVIWRPKAGFGAPLRAWVRQDLAPKIDAAVNEGRVRKTEIFNGPALEALVSDDRTGRRDNSQQLWHLLTLEEWFSQHDFVSARTAANRAKSARA